MAAEERSSPEPETAYEPPVVEDLDTSDGPSTTGATVVTGPG